MRLYLCINFKYPPTTEINLSMDNETVQSPKRSAARRSLCRAGPDPTSRSLVEVSRCSQTPYDPTDKLTLHEDERLMVFAFASQPSQMTMALSYPQHRPRLQHNTRHHHPRSTIVSTRLATACCGARRGGHEMWRVPMMMVS